MVQSGPSRGLGPTANAGLACALLFVLSACSVTRRHDDRAAQPQQASDARAPLSAAPAEPGADIELGEPPAHPEIIAQDSTEQTPATVTEPSPGPNRPAERPALETDGPRLYAKTRNVWVREKPDSRSQWIGFLWFGGSVPLSRETPLPGRGCNAWYAVQPRGYVCVDGTRATLDPSDPVLRGIYPYSPNVNSPWPHAYYGETRGAQRYAQLPSVREQRAREWDYTAQLAKIAALGTTTRTTAAVTPSAPLLPELPPTLQEDRRWLKPFSTVAWSHEVEHTGRSWLLTGDLKWIPKDRVTPHSKIEFQGVELGQNHRLPLAFFRESDRPQFEKSSEAEFVEGTRTFPRLSWVSLTGLTETVGEEVYWQTRDPQIYVRQSDAVIPHQRPSTPWGEPVPARDPALDAAQSAESASSSPQRRSWIHVSITGGWLVAYQEKSPVFTTLISPGRGGPPRPGIPPLETASTPVGNFKITGKFATANMVSPGELVHSDVPWAQNFSGPFALHSAYWHNQWGEPKSGGCVNLSPLDARWLFEFSDPPLPKGWHGVRWLPGTTPSTTLLVQR